MRSLGTLLLAGLAAIAIADIHIQDVRKFSNGGYGYLQAVDSGDEVHVHWSSDTNYTVDLKLVQQRPQGWYPVEDLFTGRVYAPGKYSYLWTVPSVSEAYKYGLWIYGTTNATTNSTADSSDASTELMDTDNIFSGDAALEHMSDGTFALNAGNSTSNASVTDLTPWFEIYAYTTVVYGHRRGLSGGAIAGIAVGSVVFLAAVVGLLVWLFMRRRRARTAQADDRSFEHEPMAQQSIEDARPPVYAMAPVESRTRQPSSKHVMSMSTMGASTVAPLSGEYRSSMETLGFEKEQATSTTKYAGA